MLRLEMSLLLNLTVVTSRPGKRDTRLKAFTGTVLALQMHYCGVIILG